MVLQNHPSLRPWRVTHVFKYWTYFLYYGEFTMAETATPDYTRFERARIIGARALQLSEGAPALIETENDRPIDVARKELEDGVVPIGVRHRG
jgi:DNA-directed RNA polymerase subunit K